MNSTNANSHGLVARMDALRPSSLRKRARARIDQFLLSRKVVRYGLVGSNVLLLIAIAWFTLGPTHSGQPLGRQGVVTAGSNLAIEPLDQLTSADIAANAAQAVRWVDTVAVINQADSADAELAIAPADATVVAKPQLVETPFKSREIKKYVTRKGDTVAKVAAKFSVTSDSIMWSNGLRGNQLASGVTLLIPPRSGIVYRVVKGDTVDSLARKFRASPDLIVNFNDIELTGLKVGQRILIPDGLQPVIASRFTSRLVWGSGNGYIFGFCTWHAAQRRIAAGNPLPTNLGNASSWYRNALANGMRVGERPKAGAVLWHTNTSIAGGLGHVGYVESVNADGSILVSDMNYPTWGQVTYRKPIPPSEFGNYRFIY
jgi:surface antigen/LysM repeat protein